MNTLSNSLNDIVFLENIAKLYWSNVRHFTISFKRSSFFIILNYIYSHSVLFWFFIHSVLFHFCAKFVSVINVTLPDDKANYIHRIGRVGRAERWVSYFIYIWTGLKHLKPVHKNKKKLCMSLEAEIFGNALSKQELSLSRKLNKVLNVWAPLNNKSRKWIFENLLPKILIMGYWSSRHSNSHISK